MQILEIDSKKSLFKRLIELWISWKIYIIKITYIALIIKLIKKYSILTKIWRLINWIVMSIFGISMVDIYGINIFENLFKEIKSISTHVVNYLSNTHFYNVLISIFKKEDIEIPKTVERPSKDEIKVIRGNNSNPERLFESNRENKTISSWFEKIDSEKSESIISEDIIDTPLYKNIYFLIGIGLVIGGFTYYYFLNISDGTDPGNFPNLYEKVNNIYDKLPNVTEKFSNIYDKIFKVKIEKGKIPEIPTPTEIELVDIIPFNSCNYETYKSFIDEA